MPRPISITAGWHSGGKVGLALSIISKVADHGIFAGRHRPLSAPARAGAHRGERARAGRCIE